MQFHNKSNIGITLIELVVTVAMVAILASIAIPSYQSHVMRGKRSAATRTLLDLAAKQQAYLVDARAYATTLSTLGFSSPPSEIAGDFTFGLTVDNGASPQTFSLTALPASSLMLKDGCGTSGTTPLAINQAGVKTPAACWQK